MCVILLIICYQEVDMCSLLCSFSCIVVDCYNCLLVQSRRKCVNL